MNFKQFHPLYKLNSGLMNSDVFKALKEKPFDTHPRHQRFAACMESFRNNLLILEYLLGRIAEHHHITYSTSERQYFDGYKFVQNTIVLGIDLKMFYVTIKILLDNIAFFIPFYYDAPILWRKEDVRDAKKPWDFRSMKVHFIKKYPSFDSEFARFLSESTIWTDDICDIRNFLVHRFHDISINQDFWTATSYGFLYEFTRKKDFIPDILVHC